MNYIKKSFEKFKQDAFSKVIYDILKWLIPALLFLFTANIIPETSSFGEIISQDFTISLYTLIIIILLTIVFTVGCFSVYFNNRYRIPQKDNFTDELTGLKNHKALKKYLPKKLKEIETTDRTLSVIVIDIDDFKKFNSIYGPNTADKVLSKVGQLLNNDKRATDETFRQYFRGDEFTVIANDTTLNDAYRAAERKRKLIESTSFVIDNVSHKLTVSCGVTEYRKSFNNFSGASQEADNYTTITGRANDALIEAKKQIKKNYTSTII